VIFKKVQLSFIILYESHKTQKQKYTHPHTFSGAAATKWSLIARICRFHFVCVVSRFDMSQIEAVEELDVFCIDCKSPMIYQDCDVCMDRICRACAFHSAPLCVKPDMIASFEREYVIEKQIKQMKQTVVDTDALMTTIAKMYADSSAMSFSWSFEPTYGMIACKKCASIPLANADQLFDLFTSEAPGATDLPSNFASLSSVEIQALFGKHCAGMRDYAYKRIEQSALKRVTFLRLAAIAEENVEVEKNEKNPPMKRKREANEEKDASSEMIDVGEKNAASAAAATDPSATQRTPPQPAAAAASGE
jgi:hypothetical protein